MINTKQAQGIHRESLALIFLSFRFSRKNLFAGGITAFSTVRGEPRGARLLLFIVRYCLRLGIPANRAKSLTKTILIVRRIQYNYPIHKGVSQRRNILLCYKNFPAGKAMLTLGKSTCGTRCRYCLINHFCVPERRNHLLLLKHLSTQATVHSACKSRFSARCRHRLINHFSVPKCRDRLLFHKHLSAHATVNSTCKSRFSACCRHRCTKHFSMTVRRSRHYFYVLISAITNKKIFRIFCAIRLLYLLPII